MPNFNIKEYYQLITATIIAIGGPAVIMLGLSKWFGEIISEKLLIRVKNKHEKGLEGLKNKYQKELEEKKTELEKTKAQFLRYSEKQFGLYNDLWRVLMQTKNLADSLWEDSTPQKLPSFAEQIRLTRRAVMDNMLLIEGSHFNKLDKLLAQFENFKIGKTKLIDIKSDNTNPTSITNTQLKTVITANREIKQRYNKFIMEIGKTFREQIRG